MVVTSAEAAVEETLLRVSDGISGVDSSHLVGMDREG